MSEFAPFYIFAAIFIVIWTIGTYNKFIKYRNMIEEGWSIIDVALKRRANLIPKLISAVRGYVQHEAKVLEDITALRVEAVTGKQNDRSGVSASESEVSHSLGNLLGVAEANPDLKASTNFAELQEALNQVEAEIAASRNKFNARIRVMNTLVEQFPSNLIAMLFHFTRDEYFQLELATEREVPGTPWDE
nr:putative LemA family protein [uncultured bacterium]